MKVHDEYYAVLDRDTTVVMEDEHRHVAMVIICMLLDNLPKVNTWDCGGCRTVVARTTHNSHFLTERGRERERDRETERKRERGGVIKKLVNL